MDERSSRLNTARERNSRQLSVVPGAMRGRQDVSGPDQRASAPELRSPRTVQEYSGHPGPSTGQRLVSSDHSEFRYFRSSAVYNFKSYVEHAMLKVNGREWTQSNGKFVDSDFYPGVQYVAGVPSGVKSNFQ